MTRNTYKEVWVWGSFMINEQRKASNVASSLLSTHGETVAAGLIYETLRTDIGQGIDRFKSEKNNYIKCKCVITPNQQKLLLCSEMVIKQR